VWRIGREVDVSESWGDKLKRGLFRRELGTTTCPICGHYNFMKDDVTKIMPYIRYAEITGIKIDDRMFWFKKTLLSPSFCKVCAARYMLFLFPSYDPYNMSFFYSSAEVPAQRDLEKVDKKYLEKYDDSFRVEFGPDEDFEGQLGLTGAVLDIQ
jgi:hypothetical protein